MSDKNEVAEVLSHMVTLCEDMADAKTNQQKTMWATDAKVAMIKGFELINGMVVEIHQLKAEVANLEHQSAALIKTARQANQLSSDILDERNQARAEVEALSTQVRLAGVSAEFTVHQQVGRAITEVASASIERDQFKVENEALRSQVANLQSGANSWQPGYDEGRRMGTKTALDEREQLRKDAERYRWFRDHSLQVVHASSICWVQHLDDAIDTAMLGDDVPDFSPGAGNKARRRAEALGIDYDAAMRKGDV